MPRSKKACDSSRDTIIAIESHVKKKWLMLIDIMDVVVRLSIVSMFLFEVTLLWWLCKSDWRNGEHLIVLTKFEWELRQKCYPYYIEDEARAKLHYLENKGVI